MVGEQPDVEKNRRAAMLTLREDLKEKYDAQYNDEGEEWRRIGAIGKAQNIIDVTADLAFDSVIEIGAGNGAILEILAEKQIAKRFTALEISSSAIKQIEKKEIPNLVQVAQFDGYDLAFDDDSFDLAICSHVVEHVEFPRKLMREIKRISKRQVFEVPIDFSFHVDRKFEHFNAYGHINIYTPGLFNFLLYTEGFEVIRSLSRLYPIEVLKFQHKKISLNYILQITKRVVWKAIPWLMKAKPNTYSVLTK